MMHDDYGTTYEKRAQNAENKVARLEARLAEAERDAARYRFLRDQDGMGNIFMHTPTCDLDATIDREIAADSAPAVLRKSVPSGWRDVLARARQSLGAAGGVGTSGAANAEMEFRIGGPLLDFVEDELEAADSASGGDK
jgi:hypothetical protein